LAVGDIQPSAQVVQVRQKKSESIDEIYIYFLKFEFTFN